MEMAMVFEGIKTGWRQTFVHQAVECTLATSGLNILYDTNNEPWVHQKPRHLLSIYSYSDQRR